MKNKKILITVITLILLVSIIGVSDKLTNNRNPEIKEKKEIPKSSKIETKKEDKLDKHKSEDLTFLMMGIDEGSRSDTLIVCKYFGSTGKISALSIPRDTRTEISGYGLDKINHAHAFKGPELSLQSVNKLLNMNIEYYISADYDLVKEIVDTIGGVDIYIPNDTEFWPKGTHHFKGEEAVEFIRYRKGYANQDLGRISSQQEFLKQVLIKMKDTKNIFALTKFMKSGIDNINTNIPINKMLSYASLLKDTDISKVEMTTLPGVPKMIDKISYIEVDKSQIPSIVQELFLNEQINSSE